MVSRLHIAAKNLQSSQRNACSSHSSCWSLVLTFFFRKKHIFFSTFIFLLPQEGHQFAIFAMKLTSDNRYIISCSNKFITFDVVTSDLARQVYPKVLPV